MPHKLDRESKKIVKAIIHGDVKRQKRIRAGQPTSFDVKASKAIEEARRALELPGYEEQIREVVINKIYESLLYNTPWELLGETYCCRRLFYEYRMKFMYLIAIDMDIVKVGQNIPA